MGRKELDTEIVLIAAIELFAQVGFANTTMAEIAKQAGITKRTLYKYFENKEDVFNATVNFIFDHLTSSDFSTLVQEQDTLEKNINNVINHFANLYTNSNFIRLTKMVLGEILAGRALEEELLDRYSKFEIEIIGLMDEILKVHFTKKKINSTELKDHFIILLKGYVLYPQVYELEKVTKEQLLGRADLIANVFLAHLKSF